MTKDILLVHEFLGDFYPFNVHDLEDLEYDMSWDWLMPVIEKIENQYSATFMWYSESKWLHLSAEGVGFNFSESFDGGSKLDIHYKAVVCFIKHLKSKNEKI